MSLQQSPSVSHFACLTDQQYNHAVFQPHQVSADLLLSFQVLRFCSWQSKVVTEVTLSLTASVSTRNFLCIWLL